MSSITDRRRTGLARFLAGTLAAIICWLAIAIAAPFAFDFETLTLFGSAEAIGGAVERSSVRPIDAGRGFIIVRPTGTHASALYRAGAWLVLPGDLSGCFR